MTSERTFIPVKLDNGIEIKVEATTISQLVDQTVDQTVGETGQIVEGDVSLSTEYLQQATEAIEGIARTVKKSIDKINPTKASVQFGLEFGYESGQITAMIVKGQGKANLNITLEWQNKSSSS